MHSSPILKGHVISAVPYIDFADVDHLLTWTGMADAIEQGHRLARAIHEDVYLEHADKGYFNRCALIPGLGLATKSVTVFPGNRTLNPPLPSIQGALFLFEDSTGRLLAVIDGELMTKWKTTGDSVLGARLLATPTPRHLLVVGAGTVGGYSVDAYCEVFPSLERVSIWNRSPDAADALAQRESHRPLVVESITDLATVAADADLITCATMSPTPVLHGHWLKPGCHVDLIGAFLPHMREADDTLMQRGNLYVDSRHSTLTDIGEIAIPLADGTITEADILGDYYDMCVTGEFERAADDITVFKNGGGGHLDLMCAMHIFKTFTSHQA